MAAPSRMGKYLGLLALVAYALVWFHFVRTDHLQYYLLDTYPDKEICLIERDKANVLITANDMIIECIALLDDDSRGEAK
ncbi:hypothetical protein [uncultured Mediterranean phage uvMED]|nr:hypothetical protein [uncultured Mediterranean phage uvMED]BAQ90161.1 hypothetical protein [uncultured Mediterranean phage uvMED]BAR19699.1 hypothetical protein [uncultured Mediterranean phage uvMED]